MPEYDAFGRRKDENPLAGLGSTADPGIAKPAAGPAAPDEPATAAAWIPAPRAERASTLDVRRPWLPLGWVVRLVVAGVAVVFALGVASAGRDAVTGAVEDARRAAPVVAAPAPADAGAGGRAAASRPLLQRRAFARALRILRRDAPGALRSLRLAADRVDVQLWRRGGRLRSAQVAAGARAASVITAGGGGFPRGNTFGYRDVRPAAPARLIRKANRRLGRRTSQVDYLVLGAFGGRLVWGVYYRDGRIAQGDARGRFLRRVG